MYNSILENILSPDSIKKLSIDELYTLADEIRKTEIEVVSKNGGHLASNLGVVELTIALHRVFDSPNDQIVFDVGHQCYAHKLLTGRYAKFSTLRQKNGISGFTNPKESEHDIFFSGHSGTSVSSTLGLAEANRLNNNENYAVSVIGDGSFTGGMVYEALNNGGQRKNRHIIVLNDNKMSISENVGAFAKYLAIIRSSPRYYRLKAYTEHSINNIPGLGTRITQSLYNLKTDIKNKIYPQSTFFEDLGYRYIGPIDGHNIELLTMAFESAKKINGPVLVHVLTTKGKGYNYAEKSPSLFHGISKFNIDSGEPVQGADSFSAHFGSILCDYANSDSDVCAITAAMSLGTGLESFKKRHPDRFFDVGIAEEHAVTFASGLARNDKIPVFAVYSAFLQRTYDQIVHDVALQNLKVIFAIDRAGFVGDDGETHNGILDVPFLNSIPNITVYSPCCFRSMDATFYDVMASASGPVAIRYPRGNQNSNVRELNYSCIDYSTYGNTDSSNVIVTYGRITSNAIQAVKELDDTFLVSLNRIKPVPNEIFDIILNCKNIFFFEEGEKNGGVGQILASELLEKHYGGNYTLFAVENHFVSPASTEELMEDYGFSANKIITKVKQIWQQEKD